MALASAITVVAKESSMFLQRKTAAIAVVVASARNAVAPAAARFSPDRKIGGFTFIYINNKLWYYILVYSEAPGGICEPD